METNLIKNNESNSSYLNFKEYIVALEITSNHINQILKTDYTKIDINKLQNELYFITLKINKLLDKAKLIENDFRLVKEAMGRYVNKDTINKILNGELLMETKKKYVAVTFMDLRDFTSMSEKMSPEDILNFLNEYFNEMVRWIDLTDGIVDKYIGDEIMAHWDQDEDFEGRETECAINAALYMRNALLNFNKRHLNEDLARVKMGCGINSGEVISGQLGTESRQETAIIGDTVNVASRIENLNKFFGTDILISDNSLQRVKGTFKVHTLPLVKVKGKEHLLKVHAVLGRNDDKKCPESIEQLRENLGIIFDKERYNSRITYEANAS